MTEFAIKTQADPAALDGFEQLQAMLDGRLPVAPIAETLGFVGFEVPQRGTAIFELDPELRHYNPIGSVHGGYAATRRKVLQRVRESTYPSAKLSWAGSCPAMGPSPATYWAGVCPGALRTTSTE